MYDTKRFGRIEVNFFFIVSISGLGFVYKHDYSDVFINNRNRPQLLFLIGVFFLCRRFWLFNWNEISYDFMKKILKKIKIINSYYGIWLYTVFYSIVSCTYWMLQHSSAILFLMLLFLWFSSVYRFFFYFQYTIMSYKYLYIYLTVNFWIIINFFSYCVCLEIETVYGCFWSILRPNPISNFMIKDCTFT